MLVRGMTGGGGGKVKYGVGETLTANKRIECGFEPTTITIIMHLPYFETDKYVVTYSKSVATSKQSYLGTNGVSAGANDVPATGFGITGTDSSGFTVHYYSGGGANQTFDYIATSEL